jgi:uncharacterized protein (DUF736 family)
MTTIGRFRKVDTEYHGEIHTVELQLNNVRIVSETNRTSDQSPTARALFGRAEIGAGWPSKTGDSLSLKFDDPSFKTPFYANLVENDDLSFSLIWPRPDKDKQNAG